MFCVESSAPQCGLVVFGASGDLTKRKLIPALANLFKRELLPADFFFLGCGRKELYDKATAIIQNARESVKALMKQGLIKPMPAEDKLLK